METITTTRKYKIALCIRTDGLEFDDRVRKEILSIKDLCPQVEFYIYMVTPNNIHNEGQSSYGVDYTEFHLLSYKKGRRFNALNAIEFYLKARKYLRYYDTVWIADHQTFVIGLMCSKPIVWDLHELPVMFLRNNLLRHIYKIIERKSSAVIHANEFRQQYLKNIGLESQSDKHFVLRNFPQFAEIDTEYDSMYYDFLKWRGNDKCVYVQGIDMETRAPYECLSAILSNENFKVVVVGGLDHKILDRIVEEKGENILGRIYQTGKIKQLKTPQYIKQCIFSLVFYKNTSFNNYYCEPNRMFQAIINGIPVIVGDNPSMTDIVAKNGFGVCVLTDGSDINQIKSGINEMIENYTIYETNIKEKNKQLLWSSQIHTIQAITNKFMINYGKSNN